MLPKISVILPATGDYSAIRKTLSHLVHQTAAAQIELVLVTPSRAKLAAPEQDWDGFAAWQVLELDPIPSIGTANAAGIRAARAPIVALVEDHSFPEPDWADRLLAAHAGPWAAVGPVVKNANPRSAVSWADYLIGYGTWAWPCASGEADFLPGHNSSYKRDILLEYEADLDRLLEAETVLHWDLRAKGHRLFLDSTVRTAHTNFSRWSTWLAVQYLHGRMFAATRVARAPAWRRWAYLAASPLIPVIRLARVTRSAARARLWTRWVHCLPALVIGLVIDGVGQAAGYFGGAKSCMARLAPYESCRIRNVSARDRREVFGDFSS